MKYIKIFVNATAANNWNPVTPNVVLILGNGYGSGINYNFQGLEM